MATCRALCAAVGFATCLLAAPAAGKFTALAGFDHQIFPSYIIATAPMRSADGEPNDHRLGDARGTIGVEVVAPADNAPIAVTIQCDECLEPSTFVGVLPKKGETYRVFPKIRYKYSALAKCVQAAPASMTFRVTLGNASEESETVTCIVRSVNDCPFSLVEGENVRDIGYTFAAYVNEQHPYVDKLLREALDRGVVNGFDGYQSGDPGAVMRQAYALWDMLVSRDMRYSSITVSAVSSDSVGCQHVRLIEDSVNNSEANCVDGSVLWASLLQRIGIDSFLVMEPTHCYAGFYVDAEHTSCYAIETTMLGADLEDEEIEAADVIEAGVPEDVRYDRSFASFAAAINYSTARLGKSLAKEDEDAVECQLIDVAAARKLGILPIGFQNGEEFVWNEYGEDESDESDEAEDEDGYDAEESTDEEDDEVMAEDESESYDESADEGDEGYEGSGEDEEYSDEEDSEDESEEEVTVSADEESYEGDDE